MVAKLNGISTYCKADTNDECYAVKKEKDRTKESESERIGKTTKKDEKHVALVTD